MTTIKKRNRSVKRFIKKNLITILVILSIALLVFSFIIPYLLTSELIPLYAADKISKNPLGDTVGGLLNPFIALSSVCVTFLAFYMQYKANKIQIRNFRKEQKKNNQLLQEQLFFRLVENLNQRIVNFTYSETIGNITKEFSSYTALNNLTNEFKATVEEELPKLGRKLLIKIPQCIPDVNLRKVMNLDYYAALYGIIAFKKLHFGRSEEDRIEYVKKINMEEDDAVEALRSVGSVIFFKVPFTERKNVYTNVYYYVYHTFRGFIDGYIKNLHYLLRFIDENNSNKLFADYLVSNLTTQELEIIFYYCGPENANKEFKGLVKKYKMLDNLAHLTSFFVDAPEEIEAQKEIDKVLVNE